MTFNNSIVAKRIVDAAAVCRLVVEGVTRDELCKRRGRGYSPIWHLAHIAAFRNVALKSLGQASAVAEWLEWGYHAEVGDPAIDDPGPVLMAIDEAGAGLGLFLALASEAKMRGEVTHALDGAPVSVAENLSFVCWHEALHLGQLGQIRHELGLDPLDF